ncbi:Ldh family oxidoreductase [Microbispora triticiradicis]|uniref:Ldh family oxidoreductase n=2 Tax=Microbispora TaxID=2005 RepID=A0ABY3LN82_9ACTN|nr:MULTISPECIES: Ldh family oxidoreductase [Microbispora]TLP50922.1 Ldh family oxidoreductase [Microbispora fusca]TYB43829.1 Ldh family oxidoreductase [Microbispora tritici]
MRNARVSYEALTTLVARVFEHRGVPAKRAVVAARALCHGDLTGVTSHGLRNLTQLYLPLFAESRVEPDADLEVLADRGASVLVDANRALGLWAAGEAMDIAVERARSHGIGMVSMRNCTHFGLAGFHSARAVRHGMIGIAASNCGRQRIARPPGGSVAMLGTNPYSIAAPALPSHPFVLDMSTTVVPTGRVRAAARAGGRIPEGWLADDDGHPVTDPAAFDRGEAHLLWLGGRPEAGAYKGFGLGLMVEVLAALLAGAGLGPSAEALLGDGGPSGRDDDIGVITIAIAPDVLREPGEFRAGAEHLFGSLVRCPPVDDGSPVRYPGWLEAETARENLRLGVPLPGWLLDELARVAGEAGATVPAPMGEDA